MPTFRLLNVDGNDLGPFPTATADWRPGDRIPRGPDATLQVVSVIDAGETSEFTAYLVVASVEYPT